MKWLIAGLNGTLAPVLARNAAAQSVDVLAWWRDEVPPELGSAHWRQRIGSSTVRAMLDELREHHGVHTFVAVLKARKFRSEALLRSLGFEPGSPEQQAQYLEEPEELVMVRAAATGA